MATLTIQLEDDLARHVEESARREHKSVSEWVKERVKPEADRAAALAAIEDEPVADETQLGLEDFPQFPETKLKQEYLGRDALYDERGR